MQRQEPEEKPGRNPRRDSARIHVRFTLTNGNNEEQELVLQRREGKWEIADFIRPNSGSLLKQIEAKTAARLKQ